MTVFAMIDSQMKMWECVMLTGPNMIVVLLMMKTFDRIFICCDVIFRCRSLERDLERLKADHATEVRKDALLGCDINDI